MSFTNFFGIFKWPKPKHKKAEVTELVEAEKSESINMAEVEAANLKDTYLNFEKNQKQKHLEATITCAIKLEEAEKQFRTDNEENFLELIEIIHKLNQLAASNDVSDATRNAILKFEKQLDRIGDDLHPIYFYSSGTHVGSFRAEAYQGICKDGEKEYLYIDFDRDLHTKKLTIQYQGYKKPLEITIVKEAEMYKELLERIATHDLVALKAKILKFMQSVDEQANLDDKK